MTTIVIHGTLAKGSSWYWNSWGEGGFCRTLAQAMEHVSGAHDIWLVNGRPVSEIAELNPRRKWSPLTGANREIETVDGRFEWSGTPEGIARGAAAVWLVRYLNALRRATAEPIRIIAHSHGCNVVKLASSLPELAPDVKIAKAVFLACPHFWEPEYVFEEPQSWRDRLDIRKQMKPKLEGRKYRYPVSPRRFGKILNLYSTRDAVQLQLAASLSGSYVPLTGGFLENLAKMLRTMDVYEVPRATRTDSDPNAQSFYENFEVPVSADCGGLAAHSVMHGAAVAALAGLWLNSQTTVARLIAQYGALPGIPASDTGE